MLADIVSGPRKLAFSKESVMARPYRTLKTFLSGGDLPSDRRFRPQNFGELRWLISVFFRFSLVRQDLPVHIVTGADWTHEKSLLRLLASIQTCEPGLRTTVWNLGLSEEVESQLKTMKWIDLRMFRFSDYPEYFDIRTDAGQYAWKPTIIHEMNSGQSELLVWLDAGNLVLGKLTWLRKIAGKRGFYSPVSSGNLKTWVHPATLERMEFRDDPRLFDNLSGGLVAYRTDDARAVALIKRWSELALDKECIAPQGSSRLNHRQDQAVLSVLSVQKGFGGRQIYRKLARPLNIVTHKDVD